MTQSRRSRGALQRVRRDGRKPPGVEARPSGGRRRGPLGKHWVRVLDFAGSGEGSNSTAEIEESTIEIRGGLLRPKSEACESPFNKSAALAAKLVLSVQSRLENLVSCPLPPFLHAR
jgi:hypothetical protein